MAAAGGHDTASGRIERAETAFVSVNDLASALRRAADAQGEHEKRIARHDPTWPDWYAAYMVAEQRAARHCRGQPHSR